MKKITTTLLFLTLGSTAYFAQIGVNTQNPQAAFHIDGTKDNPATGMPTATQQLNDVVVTSSGNVGIGTVTPDASSSLEVNTTNKGFLPPSYD